MNVADHVAHLRTAGQRMVRAAGSTSLDRAVPSCPDWTVADLLRHTGQVHRWATDYVRGRTDPPRGDSELAEPPADDELVDWLAAGVETLADAIDAAPDDLDCWTFLAAPTPRAFWARRQAHETTIHAVDAELAAGSAQPVDRQLAVDGLDELLLGFLRRSRGRLTADPPVTLGLQATDADIGWTIRIEPDHREVSRGDARGDCVVRGPASPLYLFAWNRGGLDPLDVDGRIDVLDLWREKARVTWS